ncbi:MAG: Nod factor export ATP-binding protein I [Candidatus Binatia bacterium]|nr:MAG: Nod factor export ATP-binding protein I [Candidatus Binatia bacterium]
MPVVELLSVTKRYGSRVAVDQVRLSVPRGICFGLLGPNGAGKTTTLRMIYGVSTPSSGTVRVFGKEMPRASREVRSRLGVTLQQNALIDALSPRENLLVFGRYHLLRGPALRRRTEELLDFLELRSHADVPVRHLSGGFQRRLAVALSLVNRPELLVLDEPTTGLDPAVRLALWGRIRELRSRGLTILLTTHYMEEAERLSDRVAVMAAGKIVDEDAPQALIRRHVAREALELDCAPAEEEKLLRAVGEVPRFFRTRGRLVVFAEDVQPIVERVRKLDGGERRALVVRPANLEDVFLSLTGTSLEEGA